MSVANWILALLTNTTHFDHTSRTNDAKQSKSQEHQDTLSRIQSSCLRGVEMYHAYDGGQERSCLIYSQCGVTLDATSTLHFSSLREMYWLSSIFYHHIGHHFEIKIF